MHSPWKRWVAGTLVPRKLCANRSTPRSRAEPTSFALLTTVLRAEGGVVVVCLHDFAAKAVPDLAVDADEVRVAAVFEQVTWAG
jgi:hypothetical protein